MLSLGNRGLLSNKIRVRRPTICNFVGERFFSYNVQRIGADSLAEFFVVVYF